MKENINGPVNYVRLEGEINSIKKVFYIFMDKHFDLEKQTRCNNFDSKDISNYLYRKIKKTKTPIDFFMEIRNEQIIQPISNRRGVYIEDAINLFKSEFSSQNDKVSSAKSNKRVRLHYLDIRDFFNLGIIVQKIKKEIDNILLEIKTDYKPNLLKVLDKKLVFVENYIRTIINEIDVSFQNKIDNKNKMNYYLNKIINKYNNTELQQNLNHYLKTSRDEYYEIFSKLLKEINNKVRQLKTNNEQNLFEVKVLFDKIFFNIVNLNSKISDIYLLRRILDKNYVTKGIIYSGFSHSINYIDFLVKKYNFKITYIYYLNGSIKSLDVITDLIKKYDNSQIVKLFSKEEQCIVIDDKDDEPNIIVS